MQKTNRDIEDLTQKIVESIKKVKSYGDILFNKKNKENG